MYKAIIFDLDGTLLNTIEDITDSLNIALASENLPTHGVEETKAFVGSGVKIMVERATKGLDCTDEQKKRVLDVYMKEYTVRQSIKTCPYDGMIDALKEIQRENILIGLLSNKPHQDTLRVVDHYYGLHLFNVVLGQREGVPIKPNPTALFEIMRDLKVEPKDCIFVGDSDVDMLTATNAKIDKIGVLWGFRTRQVLQACKADYIVDNPKEILDILKK
ncbi:phosphoglycolate phosphatase [Coprobacillus sp. CAG:826]|nr:phosphoglycolate phosphatase [Coprobacillus sp. CAG:826]